MKKLSSFIVCLFVSVGFAAYAGDREILGVGPDASFEEITSQYKKLLKKYHPDLNAGEGDRANLEAVLNAYKRLKNGHERSENVNIEADFESIRRDNVDGGGEVPSRLWKQGGWQKGPITIPMAHSAGLTEPSKRLGAIDPRVSEALILSDDYERSLRRDFRAVALNTNLPYLFRALYVFDSATLFTPPSPGSESDYIASVLRSLQELDKSATGMLPNGQMLFSELFMAGFANRMLDGGTQNGRAHARHPLFWRIYDNAFRESHRVIKPDVSAIFTRGSRFMKANPRLYRLRYKEDGSFEILSQPALINGYSVDYKILYASQFFWQVASEDLPTWDRFLDTRLADFLGMSLMETNGRTFMDWDQTEGSLRHILETGRSGNHRGLRGLVHRGMSCAKNLLPPPDKAKEALALSFNPAQPMELMPSQRKTEALRLRGDGR